MQLFKQIFGYTLLIVFVSFLAYKFYKTVEDMNGANLIMWLAGVIVLILIFVIRKVLAD